MKNLKILTAGFLILTLFSCSTDSNEDTQEEMSLSQKVLFFPQSDNFTHKLVTNYVNNQKVNEISYDGSNNITGTREYTYGPGTSTNFIYNSQNVLSQKMVYNYDVSNRITSIEYYNSQNQLTGTREYVYQGNDINVYYTENGTSTLVFVYKTNSNNLLYYEKRITDELEQTLTYAGDYPTQLQGSSGLQLGYEYYPTIMPLEIQKETTEINNIALISLSIQQINVSCNSYLKKVNIPGGYMLYEKEFNADNFPVHEIRYTGTITPGNENVNGETFFYYN